MKNVRLILLVCLLFSCGSSSDEPVVINMGNCFLDVSEDFQSRKPISDASDMVLFDKSQSGGGVLKVTKDFNFKDIESQGFNLVDSFMVGELELKIYEYRFGELEPKIISFISGADAVVHVLGKSKGYSIKLADSCRYIDTQSKEILGHQ